MDIITEKTEDERKYLMEVERKVQLLTLEDMDKKQHEEITDESYLLNIATKGKREFSLSCFG